MAEDTVLKPETTALDQKETEVNTANVEPSINTDNYEQENKDNDINNNNNTEQCDEEEYAEIFNEENDEENETEEVDEDETPQNLFIVLKNKILSLQLTKLQIILICISFIAYILILKKLFNFSYLFISCLTFLIISVIALYLFFKWFATTNLSVEITVFLAKFFPPTKNAVWFTNNKLISNIPISERNKSMDCNKKLLMEQTKFTEIFRNNYDIILKEYLEFEKTYNYCPEMDDVYPNGSITNWDKKWPTVTLRCYNLDTEISKYFPKTMNIINNSDIWISHAMYSILKPHKFIPRHRGPYRGVFRYQLSLEIPSKVQEPILDNLYLAVWPNTSSHEFWYPENVPDGEPTLITWKNGLDFLFDDTCVHEVYNNTNQRRIILFADIERVDISLLSRIIHKIFMNIAKYLPAIKTAKKVQDGYINKYQLKRCEQNLIDSDQNEENDIDCNHDQKDSNWIWMNSSPEILPFRKARKVIARREKLFGKRTTQNQ